MLNDDVLFMYDWLSELIYVHYIMQLSILKTNSFIDNNIMFETIIYFST